MKKKGQKNNKADARAALATRRLRGRAALSPSQREKEGTRPFKISIIAKTPSEKAEFIFVSRPAWRRREQTRPFLL